MLTDSRKSRQQPHGIGDKARPNAAPLPETEGVVNAALRPRPKAWPALHPRLRSPRHLS
jgi:hypothetical protein